MFRKLIADARQTSDTKKTELRRIKCENAIVYRNYIWISGFSASI